MDSLKKVAPIRVLHVLKSSKFSGAENVAVQIISMFGSDSSFEFQYSSPDSGGLREIIESKGVSYVPISSCNVVEIRRVIALFKPDIIHAHDRTASIICAFVSGRVPYISHLHCNFLDMNRVSLKSLAYLYAAQRAKKIIAVSNSVFDKYVFKRLISSRVTVLRNVILPVVNKNMKMPEVAYDIAFIGRISYQKNPEMFIDVIKELTKFLPDISVAMCGVGDLEDVVKNLIKEKDLGGNIHFLGFRRDATNILSRSKLLVMTSRFEGTPMVVLEAMSLNKPIVSTPTDGIIELITHGKNGYLDDDVHGLVSDIRKLLTKPVLYRAMSEGQKNANKKCNNMQAYKLTVKKIYLSLLGKIND